MADNDVNIYTQIRLAIAAAGSVDQGAAGYPVMNNRKETLVSRGLTQRTELTRQGASWVAVNSTAVAAVTALPTTTPHYTFFNNEAPGGKSYVIDKAGVIVTTASAGPSGISVAACVSKGSVVPGTFASTFPTISTCSGRPYNGNIKFRISNPGTQITDDGWFIVGGEGSGGANTTAGSSIMFPVNGAIIVPPQAQCAFALVSSTIVLVGKLVVAWAEMFLPYSY